MNNTENQSPYAPKSGNRWQRRLAGMRVARQSWEILAQIHAEIDPAINKRRDDMNSLAEIN